MSEDLGVDRVEHRVTIRANRFAHMREWTEEDFDTLLASVEWLRKAHEHLDSEGEPDPEDLARIPGPLDVPINFKED